MYMSNGEDLNSNIVVLQPFPSGQEPCSDCFDRLRPHYDFWMDLYHLDAIHYSDETLPPDVYGFFTSGIEDKTPKIIFVPGVNSHLQAYRNSLLYNLGLNPAEAQRILYEYFDSGFEPDRFATSFELLVSTSPASEEEKQRSLRLRNRRPDYFFNKARVHVTLTYDPINYGLVIAYNYGERTNFKELRSNVFGFLQIPFQSFKELSTHPGSRKDKVALNLNPYFADIIIPQ